MNKISFNVGLTLVFLLFASTACKDIAEKADKHITGKAKEMKFVVTEHSDFLPMRLSNGLLKFKVFNRRTDTVNIDTLIFSRENFDHLDRDTIISTREYILSLDEEISLSQLENFLAINDFSYKNLREHIYWMAKATHAKIVENKNQFGDIQSCWLVTPEGEYVPTEYWSYRANGNQYKEKYTVNIQSTIIAERRYKGNYMVFLLLDMPFIRKDSHMIPLNLDKETPKYKLKNDKKLHLLVRLRSDITITREGLPGYYPDFSPFSIKILEHTSFPRKAN